MQFAELFRNNNEREWDIVAKIYEMICKEENQGRALQEFLEYSMEEYEDIEETINIPVYFTKQEIQVLEKNCGQLIEGALNKLILERLPKTDFYQKLWKKIIVENSMLEEEKEKRFALYYIWKDNRIPYFDISGGLTMSNEEFKEICKYKEELLKKVNFVFSINFLQRTQRSSLLLEIVNECKDEKERAVVLAHGLYIAENKGIEKIMNKLL